jgi:hypothetical protein
VSYDNWLIIEVASEPNNALLADWLIELLVSERDVSMSAAARFVADLQQLGTTAAELLANTRALACSVSR